MSDPYVDPVTNTLRNRLGITDRTQLDRAERAYVQVRLEQGTPTGNFDLSHLRAIHRHLFQDLYPWAGELRTVELAKGSSQFQPVRFIETGMADIHARLKRAEFLRGQPSDSFATCAAQIIGDVNHVHPFREGNGRTQLEYLRHLAYRAGHRFEQTRLDQDAWIEASREAHRANYGPMAAQIRAAVPDRSRSIETITAELERDTGLER